MKKSDFIKLVFGIVATLLFGIGMCMCLLPEWNTFTEGVVVTAVGAALLLSLGLKAIVNRPKSDKKINWRLVGKVAFGVLSSLVLGVGMCMVMVWQMMLWGIVIGVVGMIMLLCLIPMCIGFKEDVAIKTNN